MKTKIKILIFLILLTICMGTMSVTYSRYVASTDSNIEVALAKWQILVNNNDITTNKESTLTITPNIVENTYVRSNVIAPTSKGYFDIDIDPTNVDVSFSYQISLDKNLTFEDIVINKYAIIDETYNEQTGLELVDITNNEITKEMIVGETAFSPFSIRVFFEWYDDVDNVNDDDADTLFANDATNNNTNLSITALVNFTQLMP